MIDTREIPFVIRICNTLISILCASTPRFSTFQTYRLKRVTNENFILLGTSEQALLISVEKPETKTPGIPLTTMVTNQLVLKRDIQKAEEDAILPRDILFTMQEQLKIVTT